MMETTNAHFHEFPAASPARNQRRTWAVIWLCSAMLIAQIVGGMVVGSLSILAGALHMAAQVGSLLIAAMACFYARRHATDARFSFGVGKLRELAEFTGAVIVGTTALFIGCDALSRLSDPVGMDADGALPLALIGLVVNITSAWMLGSDAAAGPEPMASGRVRRIETPWGPVGLNVSDEAGAPRFRLFARPQRRGEAALPLHGALIETERPDGHRHLFRFADRGSFLESTDDVAQPHEFVVRLSLSREGRQENYVVDFEAQDHSPVHTEPRKHLAARVHAVFNRLTAQASVPLLVLGGLLVAKLDDWLWIDPMVAMGGAWVSARWSIGRIRDTGPVLLDMSAEGPLALDIREAMEINGDRVASLHLWRLGSGQLGAIVSVSTDWPREDGYYRDKLKQFDSLSHLTLEIRPH